ncbi:basal body-orientation factor 1 isoform X2 [Heliangelus exortis]|uniref:basal body-orientation factor 1 isoform X2 n=1 Tax=Heliangelus exortis TaxID=472823 RepID=UPI003A9348C9
MAGGRPSLCRSVSFRRPAAAKQASRVPKEESAEVDAALREAQLPATEAYRAEYRGATRCPSKSSAELQRRQREAAEQTDYYAQQIKELEMKFQKKVREFGQIKLEPKSVKEICREKTSMEKELEDKRPGEDVEEKQIMMTETTQNEDVLQLNSTEREVFKENVCLHSEFATQLKEIMELQKIKQKLEDENTLLLQEKEASEGLIQKKSLQINCQKAEIEDLQHKVEKLEMALYRMSKESVREAQKTQHQVLIENQASMVEIKKLQQLLEMKDREMNRVKKLARNIINERTEVERFFLDALEHVKQEIVSNRKQYKKKAQTAYYKKMMEACAGKEEFPKIKTFKSNINSTNSVYRDLEEAEKHYWEKKQFKKVDISELTWEQKEHVLRLLFAKMNGRSPWKHTRVSPTSVPAPDDAKDEGKIGCLNEFPADPSWLHHLPRNRNKSASSSAPNADF